jgi:hypothetical protein
MIVRDAIFQTVTGLPVTDKAKRVSAVCLQSHGMGGQQHAACRRGQKIAFLHKQRIGRGRQRTDGVHHRLAPPCLGFGLVPRVLGIARGAKVAGEVVRVGAAVGLDFAASIGDDIGVDAGVFAVAVES